MSKSALILEDESVIALLLRQILKDQEFNNIRVEQKGNRGVEAALEMIPDLIIADYNLPEKNAFEIIKELRSDLSDRFPAILIVSGCAIYEELLLDVDLTPNNFIAKPFYKSDINNFLNSCF